MAHRPITADMTVESVLQSHPAMLRAFIEAGFKPLAVPMLRKLFAGVVTVAGAARKKGWDAARLEAFLAQLNRIHAEVPHTVSEATVEVDTASGPPAERHDWGVFIDNRGLEPPQPMMRILGLLETLGPDERLEAHNDREPMMLLPRLEELGWAYVLDPQPDGSCRFTIRRR